MKEIKAFTAAQVTQLLYFKFGALREWSDLLNDHRRFPPEQPIAGAFLVPVARWHDKRCARPIYDGKDVIKFIQHISEQFAEACPRANAQPVVIEINDTLSGFTGGWRMTKVISKACLAPPR